MSNTIGQWVNGCLKVVLHPNVFNTNTYGVASFSTADSKSHPEYWVSEFNLEKDTVSIRAEADAYDEHKVYVTLGIEAPQSLIADDKLLISRPDVQEEGTREIVLTLSSDGRLLGEISFPCGWQEFVGAGTELILEIKKVDNDN
jgi:hypothetical protein